MEQTTVRAKRTLPPAPPGTLFRAWVDTTVAVAQLRWALLAVGLDDAADQVKAAEYDLLALYDAAPTWPRVR